LDSFNRSHRLDEQSRLTHQDDSGRPVMVDVSGKQETERVAEAEGELHVSASAIAALRTGRTPKGDPLVVAQIAGIQAAKRTAELIPLCHTLPLTQVTVTLDIDADLPGVRAHSVAKTLGRTGVEMEALTAVTVALLTVYDMLKALDRSMTIQGVKLIRKSGGRSGSWSAKPTVSER
jgi:cyclic pyranopterin phosphate synthase